MLQKGGGAGQLTTPCSKNLKNLKTILTKIKKKTRIYNTGVMNSNMIQSGVVHVKFMKTSYLTQSNNMV